MKTPAIFPDPRNIVDDHVGISRDLNCEMLIEAYSCGIFPWPYEENSILWSSPRQRGILHLEDFHIPRSLSREMKKFPFQLRINSAFSEVICNCAAAERPGQDGSWITSKIIRTYNEFHRLKMAHSFEAWMPDGTLAGGLYGIVCGRIFCGESMFYKVSGASKFCFVKLVEELKKHEFALIDTQMVTPLTGAFGAKELPCREYFALLDEYGAAPAPFEW